jgi:D-glycero-D-manno-heptose 1,7-bisphosphate phosphatase
LTARPAKSAAFLDRDGVLNEAVVLNGKPYPPRDLSELVITTGAPVALEELKRESLLLIVVTNQPDITRGKAGRDDVDKINARLAAILPLGAIEVCAHDDKEQCDCRKPKPGMILRARERFGVDLARSFMVGDRWRDIEAGRRAGCRTILLGNGYGEIFPWAADHQTRLTAGGGILDHSTEQARAGGHMKTLSDLKVTIFADGAEKAGMLEVYAQGLYDQSDIDAQRPRQRL